MLELYLIRHGEAQSQETPELVCGRSNHVRLTTNGACQAVTLGDRLKNEELEFDAVYSSPATRCHDTAKIACIHMKYPTGEIILEDALQELSQGDWEGHPRDECYTDEVWRELERDNYVFRAPNGESQKDVEERVMEWLDEEIIPRFDPEKLVNIAAFTHAFTIKCALRGIMRFDPFLVFPGYVENTAIVKIGYNERGWKPFFGDAGHVGLKTRGNW